jgi:hypothetical protein
VNEQFEIAGVNRLAVSAKLNGKRSRSRISGLALDFQAFRGIDRELF